MAANVPEPRKPRPVRGFVFAEAGDAAAGTRRWEPWVYGVVLGLLYVVALSLALKGGLRGDELYHYAQIQLFRHGDFRLLDTYLTTLPGYHAAVAGLLALGGLDSLASARIVNAAFGLLALAAFHAVRRRAWPGTETLATAQLMALPILAPYFFLVYTDVLALALVLGATAASLSRRHLLAAVALLGALAVRQNNVAWAGLLAVLAIWPIWREGRLAAWHAMLRVALPYGVPVLAFVIFLVANGSVSMSHGQAALHPASLHLGNPLFALFLAGLLLPLQVIDGLPAAWAWLRARPWRLLWPAGLLAVYWFGFHADNPYNTALPDFLPRNAFLLALEHDLLLRAATGVVIVLAACGLATTRLRPDGAWWLYPFAAFFLAASWLVEQRYAMVPLVLWLALREPRGRGVELATLVWWLLLAGVLVGGMISGRFFL